MSSARYKVLKKIGDGNFTAGVYLARHKDLDRDVALKLIEVAPGEDRDELLEEGRTMAALGHHDHVVQVIDAGDWDADVVYIASEPCLDGSLEKLVPPGGMQPAEACRMISDACKGLEYMHSHGLLHLDIRPANILVAGGLPKLCDFGLARWTTNANVPTVYAPHAAPEMLAQYDGTKQSDQYAIGMSLAHLLSDGAVCSLPPDPPDAKSWRKWNPLQALPANVPVKLARVLKQATAFDPGGRFQSVEEFKRAVDSATPSVSFSPPRKGVMTSVDSAWEIEGAATSKGASVTVRHNGRRRNDLSVAGVDDRAANRHVSKLITQFASVK